MTRITKFKDLKMGIVNEIKKGKIFIYPTDTIYGLGCNALKPSSVSKIREIKKREKKPFSVIAPSKKWIYKNLKGRRFVKKLPGPYTLIMKMKHRIVGKEVTNLDTLGVRIPKHPFTRFIKKADVPFITTSVNLAGEKPITKIREIPKRILDKVDIVIDQGTLNKRPSTIIDLTGKIIKRGL